MEREKRYVPVIVRFDADGKLRPLEIEFDESHKYPVDKILDIRRAACQSVGGVGDRYTCLIQPGEKLRRRRCWRRLCPYLGFSILYPLRMTVLM